MSILNRGLAYLSDKWGRFRSISFLSVLTPDVSQGDDGFTWLDVGEEGTREGPILKYWDEEGQAWVNVAAPAGDTVGMSVADHTAIGDASPHHLAVSLGGGSDAALSLAGQVLSLADVLTPTEHAAIGDASPHHAAVTLDANVGVLLDVSAGQVLGLDKQASNTVLAGPDDGADDEPTFRALSLIDLPHTHVNNAIFWAYASAQTNVTGAGTTYTVLFDNEVSDPQAQYSSPTYTAPVTGIYLFTAQVWVTGITAAMTTGRLGLITTAGSYYSDGKNPGACANATGALTFGIAVIVPMVATDTANINIKISNGAGDTADIYGGAEYTWFAGRLLI